MVQAASNGGKQKTTTHTLGKTKRRPRGLRTGGVEVESESQKQSAQHKVNTEPNQTLQRPHAAHLGETKCSRSRHSTAALGVTTAALGVH